MSREEEEINIPFFTRWYRLLLLVAVSVASAVTLFLVLGYRSYRTATNLRTEICRLQLGNSSFEEVSRISRQYQGHIFAHDNLPATCSPEGCTYQMIVENPLSRLIRIGPRTAFIAQVNVYDNVLKGRELIVARMRGGRELDVLVGQFSESDWDGDARIARYSKIAAIEVHLPAHASARFEQLAQNLKLSCVATALGCNEAADILPFLKEKAR